MARVSEPQSQILKPSLLQNHTQNHYDLSIPDDDLFADCTNDSTKPRNPYNNPKTKEKKTNVNENEATLTVYGKGSFENPYSKREPKKNIIEKADHWLSKLRI
jgi:hypothetical protein